MLQKTKPNLNTVCERDQNLLSGLMTSLFNASTSTTAVSNVSLRVEGTCTWILKHPKFLQWQAKNHSLNLLWISGVPGCGKTVLSSFLSEELKANQPSTLVCSILCYDKIDAKMVLCNIIHQLLSVKKELARHALSHWEQKGERFAQHWPTLCDIWKACCNDPLSGNIILMIDALDECDKSSRAD
jgi:Cdc6-like AAA superfamily ATPase